MTELPPIELSAPDIHGWTALVAFAAVSMAFVSVGVSLLIFVLGALAMTALVIRPGRDPAGSV